MESDATLVSALLRTDFRAFATRALLELERKPPRDGKHIELVCRTLGRLHSGDVTRQVINQPPRTLKSFLGAVAFPAWELGHHPDWQVIIACHDERLAETHADKIRQIMRGRFYQEAFPETRLRPDFSGRDQFRTDRGGQVLAISLGSGVTGHGAHLMVIDDPIDARKAESEADREAANTTLGKSLLQRLQSQVTSRVLLLQQRLHENDPSGYLMQRGGFEHLAVPLIAEADHDYIVDSWIWRRPAGHVLDPDEFPDEVIEDLKRNPAMFAAQYQQDPCGEAAAIISSDRFIAYEQAPPEAEHYVLSFDTAMKASGSSYSVCLIFRTDGRYYFLENVWRARVEYEFLEAKAVELVERYRPILAIVEDASFGRAIASKLEPYLPGKVQLENPVGSKLFRLQAVCDVINAGRVRIPRFATFNEAFLREVCSFPGSASDDQVDALSQFLKVMREHGPKIFTPKIIASAPVRHKPHPMRDPRAAPMNYVGTGRVDIRRLKPSSFRR